MSVFRMVAVRHRSLTGLLIIMVLFTMLMPAHYHLHHLNDDNATAHQHAIDLHLVAADSDQSHHDEDTSIFDATPDVIVKKTYNDSVPYLLLMFVLVLLTVLYRFASRFKPGAIRPEQHYPYFTPPLRAPPVR